MSGIDLKDAVHAAWLHSGEDVTKVEALAMVAAAAPFIAAQVAEQIAEAIEASLHEPGRSTSVAVGYGFECAAKVAREWPPR